ncbi:unnamed protein product [Chrysoparadoxa australica]
MDPPRPPPPPGLEPRGPAQAQMPQPNMTQPNMHQMPQPHQQQRHMHPQGAGRGRGPGNVQGPRMQGYPRGMPLGPGNGRGPRGPPRPPPPSFFPGAASMFEQLDKRLLVVLRDGRHLVGVLRTYDQYSNLVLEDTHERHTVGDLYGDIPLGLYLIRGDNVVLMGEIDAEKEGTSRLKEVSSCERSSEPALVWIRATPMRLLSLILLLSLAACAAFLSA